MEVKHANGFRKSAPFLPDQRVLLKNGIKTAEKRQGSTAQAPPRPEVAPLALSCTAKISPAHLEKLAIV